MDNSDEFCAIEGALADDDKPSPVYATLHFYYNDPDSMRRFRECNQAADVKLAIWEFDQKLRTRWRYGEEDQQTMLVKDVRSMMWAIFEDCGIHLEYE